jgi:serine/threonine-protein kinase HipA
LSGLLHKRASDGIIDYEEFIRLARRLVGMGEAEECFRRGVFNLLSTNRDDHGRNHAFLYDESARTWTLSPAYDLTPNVANVLIGLSWLGSQQIPQTFEALERLAEIGGLSSKKARAIYDEVEAATIGGWRKAATAAGVPKDIVDHWEQAMQIQTRALQADVRKKAPGSKRSQQRKT